MFLCFHALIHRHEAKMQLITADRVNDLFFYSQSILYTF